MRNLTIGVHVVAPDAPGLVDGIVVAERAGLDVAWLTVGRLAPDPFPVFAAAAARTERIQFGTSIVPTFPRHPLSLAQSALAVDEIAPGRLRLGVGPSHQPMVESVWGIPFERPQAHLREYLTILKAVLQEGRVAFQGEILRADGEIDSPREVPVMAAALRPRAFRLCGELADGAISWMCPWPYIRDVAAPALAAGAAQAGRAKPPMVVHAPIVVSEDAVTVRTAARQQLGRYLRLPYYARMFQDAGFPEAAGPELSETLAEALVITGSEEQVAERIATLPDYGADELLAMPLPVGADPQAGIERTLALLGELARADS